MLARGYAEIDLSDYFQHNPQQSTLIAKIKILPEEHTETSSLIFFKIRHSARTSELKPILRKALTASPELLANRSLARQLNASYFLKYKAKLIGVRVAMIGNVF